MEQLLDQIRAALVTGAADDARAAGAAACRTILSALDAKAGEPMHIPVTPVASPPLPSAGPLVAATSPANDTPSSGNPRPSPTATVQALVTALRGLPPDQLLDLAVTRLRAVVPDGAAVSVAQPVRFNLVPLGAAYGPTVGK